MQVLGGPGVTCLEGTQCGWRGEGGGRGAPQGDVGGLVVHSSHTGVLGCGSGAQSGQFSHSACVTDGLALGQALKS